MKLDTTLLDDVSNGDILFKKQLIEMILAEVTEAIPEMMQYIDLQDVEKIHIVSHKLKTSLGYMRWTPIEDLNKAIEASSNTKMHNPDLKSYIQNLNNLLPEYRQAIENLATSL